MTGAGSWSYNADDSSAMFAHDGTEVVPRVSRTIGSKKAMITVFCTANRLLKLAYLPQGQKCNREYLINEIFEGINEECNHGVGYRVTTTLKSHMDNCRIHNAQDTPAKIGTMKLTRLSHPAYSPDLRPCDFWFFARAKTAFQDPRFADADDLLPALTDLSDSATFEELQSVFTDWILRLEWVIAHKGESSIKSPNKIDLVSSTKRHEGGSYFVETLYFVTCQELSR
jgi:hypothetical protein